MDKQNNELAEKKSALKASKEALDVKLIIAFGEKQRLAEDLASKKEEKMKIEKECRSLQTKRAASNKIVGGVATSSSSSGGAREL